jgi:hypothetical protein
VKIVRMSQRRGENTGGFCSPLMSGSPCHRIGDRVAIELIAGLVSRTQSASIPKNIGRAGEGVSTPLHGVEPGVSLERRDPSQDGMFACVLAQGYRSEGIGTVVEMAVMNDVRLPD